MVKINNNSILSAGIEYATKHITNPEQKIQKQSDKDIKINMLCGKRFWGPDWLHIDGEGHPHVDDGDIFIACKNKVSLIVCSHGIAYFDRDYALVILKNWFDALKSGGVLEISTPDLSKIAFMLSNNKCILDEVTGPLYGKMSMREEIVYHKTGYDFNTMQALLEAAGFVDVKLYDHRNTCHPNTGNREDKFDDHSAAYLHGELISLNVEARKL